jgi:hypothetical protein
VKAPPESTSAVRAARVILVSFLFTFIAARLVVFLIMARKIPDFFLYVGDVHVHHLNYGIFLLAGVGAYMLLVPAGRRARSVIASAYGIGLALTFDEFGMWLHLGGSYWQRASWDAVAVLAALFGVIALAPALAKFRSRHWAVASLLAIMICLFSLGLWRSFSYVKTRFIPRLQMIESEGPR